MEKKTFTTDEILDELGISEHLFRKRLFYRGVITSMNGDYSLPIEYLDWAVFDYFEGMTEQHLLWTQTGHDKLLEIFGEQENKIASLFSQQDTPSYSTDAILKELGISKYAFMVFLVNKRVIKHRTEPIVLRNKYESWGNEQIIDGRKQFIWTKDAHNHILELFRGQTNTSETNQADYTLPLENPNVPNTYSSDEMSKTLNLSKIELRQFLVDKGIIRSMKGKIGVHAKYSDWGTLKFNDKSNKRVFVWTEKGWKNIIELFNSSQKEAKNNLFIKGDIVWKQPLTTNSSQLQRTFKAKYVDRLLEQAKSGISLPNYALDTFPIEQENILYIPSIVHPNGLLDKMNPAIEKDFESAVALYEAYPNLSPLQASDKSFWVYLAHTELFPYVRERYPDVCMKNFNNSAYVLDHWFFNQSTPLFHALAGLWWAVYFSVDDESEESHKYDYTSFIFSRDSNIRTKFFVRYLLFRHKEAAIGILKFLMEDYELCASFFRQRVRYITKYFNKLGGTRQLVSLDREFFYHELKKIRPQIMAIQSDEDVKNSI